MPRTGGTGGTSKSISKPFIMTILLIAIVTTVFMLRNKSAELPAGAHVQDLGSLKLPPGTRTQLPVSTNVALYCVFSRPDQLPQKVELFASVTSTPDANDTLSIDVVPTPADYNRLALKHLSVPYRPGERCQVKVSENEWLRFTPL